MTAEDSRIGARPVRRAESPRRLPRIPLWYSVLAGPSAWGVTLLVDYYLSNLHCSTQFTSYKVGSASWFEVGIVIMGIIAALTAIGGGLTGWRLWRGSGMGEDWDAGGPLGRGAFMALAGTLLDCLFLLVIVVTTVPVFLSSQCATT